MSVSSRSTRRLALLLVGGAAALPGVAAPALARTLAPAGRSARSEVGAGVGPGGLASLVDTRTWTSGEPTGSGGNTFPGADVPFGMVQWSPDTRPTTGAAGEVSGPVGRNGGGYDYTDRTLWGYSLTHVSGPGCGSAGDVPMLPLTGALPAGNPNLITTRFSHAGEVAQAGYYSAQSNQPSTISSSFTATPHSSMARFTYPATTQADFLIKLMASQHGDFGDGAQVVGNNEIEGSDTSGDFCNEKNNGGQPQQYTVYFDIVFDRPFTSSEVITNPGQTNPAAVALTFNTTQSRVIRAKVGISYVSAADAKLNWQTENPGWNFNAVRQRAQTAWNELLGRIQVAGGSRAQTQEFYSLLYKAFLEPNITSDVNGQFMGADLQVHSLAPGQQNQYGMFSGWDTYHSLAQLQAMLDPQPAGDMVQSQLNYYGEDKVLQQWGYDNLNNYVMVGDPADAIIADDYTFGARNFATQQALADMLTQATTVNDVRPGEALEQQYGYLPEDGVYGCCSAHGFMSALLEYDNADLALAQFASDMGDHSAAQMLIRRANNWENLFDPDTDLLTSRLADGQFEPGVTPTFTGTFPTDPEPYIEGDPYEYLWDVPNDYSALFSLLGGDATVQPMLMRYLSRPNGRGMYAQLTNEFDFGEEFAPDYARDPALTQQVVANMRDTVYQPGPLGLTNNDDLGANSSMFVWEMLGMYPENAGRDTLVFASPGFPRETIHLSNGRAITIDAPGASPNSYYVRSLKLNGAPYSKLSVGYSRLARGASLDWTLGSKPTTWGSAAVDAPPSYTSGLKPVVGFLSEQNASIASGSSTTVEVGAQNATASRQTARVQVSVQKGSGVSVTPANATISIPPRGRARVAVTVRASRPTALAASVVTARVAVRGAPAETVPLDVHVAPLGGQS